MSRRRIPYNQKTCSSVLGIYHKAMETDSFVYFVNFLESDENGQVKMYRKGSYVGCPLELVSDNYFALVGLERDIEEDNQTWLSAKMKKELELRSEC
jgi:hypothetical protein